MNWEMIGAIGEVGGAVAVVLSLVYLAQQVRNSSRQDRRTQFTQLNRDFLNFTDALSRDETLSEVIFQGIRDRSALSKPQLFRFNATVLGRFRAQEALFYYHRDGGIDDWRAEGWEAAMLDFVGLPGVQTYWSDRSHWFTADFRTVVDELIANQSSVFLQGYEMNDEE